MLSIYQNGEKLEDYIPINKAKELWNHRISVGNLELYSTRSALKALQKLYEHSCTQISIDRLVIAESPKQTVQFNILGIRKPFDHVWLAL